MTRSRDVADTQDNLGGAVAPFVAGKNGIINGGFDIWQRGTSFSSQSSFSGNSADRWANYRGSVVGGENITQQSPSATLPQFRYCARVQRASGNTSTETLNFNTILETNDSLRFAGQNVVFSFYARAGSNFSASSNALGFNVQSGQGVDQNPTFGFTSANNFISTNATLTTSWQRFTATAVCPSATTQLAVLISYVPTGTAGANDYFEITGVQLELGAQATPFARAGGSIGGELALCQRYYYRNTSGAAYTTLCASGYSVNTTDFAALINLPVTMRIAPISLDYSTLYIAQRTTTNVDKIITSATLSEANQQIVQVIFSASAGGLTANSSGYIKSNNSAAAYIGLSAEL